MGCGLRSSHHLKTGGAMRGTFKDADRGLFTLNGSLAGTENSYLGDTVYQIPVA